MPTVDEGFLRRGIAPISHGLFPHLDVGVGRLLVLRRTVGFGQLPAACPLPPNGFFCPFSRLISVIQVPVPVFRPRTWYVGILHTHISDLEPGLAPFSHRKRGSKPR